ncbi:MAG: 4-(cytidine 5'-diphospho)-2-C-methyl-D-erythritol kinase [Trueperella sp.]|nr:4-(cytidine 5'-diphospho)-2-C-methyl-D-erythritol kinase [Trueperella sp.]
MKVIASAPAKVNLALHVGGPRPDGFHPLDTVFQALNLRDEVTAVEDAGLSMTISGLGANLPTDHTNLAMRAAQLLLDTYGVRPTDRAYGKGARLHIHKVIPVAGGMAGGSADAAATLAALNKLWELELGESQLLELAAQLGSDVPFCLVGGVAHGTGRGEKMQQIYTVAQFGWVLLTRSDGLSTPAVFREFDRLYPAARDPRPTTELRTVLRHGTLAEIGRLLSNDLQAAAISLRPELGDVLSDLSEAGYGAILSGSGPTIAVLCDPDECAELAKDISNAYPELAVYSAAGPTPGAQVTVEQN